MYHIVHITITIARHKSYDQLMAHIIKYTIRSAYILYIIYIYYNTILLDYILYLTIIYYYLYYNMI